MPVYNADKFIAEAIESILNQTFTDFEFIIVDDGSTDGTVEIIKKFQVNDARIVFLKNDINLGISKTRNRLIMESKGDYIVWQDADDISLPERINLQVQFMDGNPDVGICGGALEFFNENGILSYRKFATNDASLRASVFQQSPVAQPSAIIRKSVLELSGLFDVSLPQAEDLDLSYRIGVNSKFANIPDVVLRYRFHNESITTSKLRQNIRCTLSVRTKAHKKYGYKMRLKDRIHFICTYFFQFLPAKVTYFVFNLLRNNHG